MCKHFPKIVLKLYRWRVTIIRMIMQLRFESTRSVFSVLLFATFLAQTTFSALAVESAEHRVVSIQDVKLRQIEAEKFMRISEFFTGRENTSGRVFIRSNPAQRGGLYFIARLEEKLTKLPAGMKVGIDFFEAGSAQMRQYIFEIPKVLQETNKLFLGLTDEGMLEKQLPVAWRVYLLNADESLHSELKSYLWEMPEKSAQAD